MITQGLNLVTDIFDREKLEHASLRGGFSEAILEAGATNEKVVVLSADVSESVQASAFKEKYPEQVKVYSMGEFSKEFCGGPHVTHTGEIGHFKILKEESSASGVRRIKGILE